MTSYNQALTDGHSMSRQSNELFTSSDFIYFFFSSASIHVRSEHGEHLSIAFTNLNVTWEKKQKYKHWNITWGEKKSPFVIPSLPYFHGHKNVAFIGNLVFDLPR